jgi:RNA polymerase subunit RPABC4/transcription elongation factor Spt4
MDDTSLLLGLLLWLACALGAMAIANQRGGSNFGGFILGFLLGPIGVLLAFYVFDGKRCPQCQQTIPAAAKRCPKCQASLEEPVRAAVVVTSATTAPASVSGTKKCPDCAEEIRTEARKCRFCGYRFSPEVVAEEVVIPTECSAEAVEIGTLGQPATKREGGGGLGPGAVAIIGLAVLLVVVLFVILTMQPRAADEPATSAQPAAAEPK